MVIEGPIQKVELGIKMFILKALFRVFTRLLDIEKQNINMITWSVNLFNFPFFSNRILQIFQHLLSRFILILWHHSLLHLSRDSMTEWEYNETGIDKVVVKVPVHVKPNLWVFTLELLRPLDPYHIPPTTLSQNTHLEVLNEKKGHTNKSILKFLN